jgi:predicted TIM-barrel fold metal-dependent hydrolase
MSTTTTSAPVVGLEKLRGRITDCDAHEMVPTQLWSEAFGPVGEMLAPLFDFIGDPNFVRPDVHGDTMEITEEIVWNQKGCDAPGAIDMKRRPEVLDVMGVQRQLIFPSFGLLAFLLQAGSAGIAALEFAGADLPKDLIGSFDTQALGDSLTRAHNDWAIETAKIESDRVRPVAILPSNTVESMISEAERVIAGGGRAFWIPSAVPPAGTSPGNPALDPFWTLAEESDAIVTLHLGDGITFTDPAWRDAPAFAKDNGSIEFPQLNAYTLSTLSMAAENFLAAMVLGGVFERHPKLRFGIIELGANWVGPLAERMDIHGRKFTDAGLTMKPSEYLARNVRVTPFHFEPIGRIVERYPDLADVYVYSSDYPHHEGGKAPHRQFYDSLSALGDESIVEKFFVTNGELLMPA